MIDVSVGENLIVCVGTISCDGFGLEASLRFERLRNFSRAPWLRGRGIGWCFCAAGDVVGLEYGEIVFFLIQYRTL